MCVGGGGGGNFCSNWLAITARVRTTGNNQINFDVCFRIMVEFGQHLELLHRLRYATQNGY